MFQSFLPLAYAKFRNQHEQKRVRRQVRTPTFVEVLHQCHVKYEVPYWVVKQCLLQQTDCFPHDTHDMYPPGLHLDV